MASTLWPENGSVWPSLEEALLAARLGALKEGYSSPYSQSPAAISIFLAQLCATDPDSLALLTKYRTAELLAAEQLDKIKLIALIKHKRDFKKSADFLLNNVSLKKKAAVKLMKLLLAYDKKTGAGSEASTGSKKRAGGEQSDSGTDPNGKKRRKSE
ncbi:hypothetical protein MNV49_005367 [Pseudohyphozyma bogoriensis]|nr:hypothetical protein MNV49_005367 [Pseudohyphozyma bogoriensis]